MKAYARRPELLVVTKSTARSTVHRPGYMDYIAVKRFDARGDVVGEHRFLGLYTSTAYSTDPDEIPLLRRKTGNVTRRAHLPPGGHAEKALHNILATYPRDELFQIAEDDLLRTAMGILHLGERQRFRLFVRRDPFERFLSCLIYAPRENYTTEMRQKWQTILMEAFNGSSSEFNVHLSESKLARIMIIVRTRPGHVPDFDVRALEARLAKAARLWGDDLKQALVDAAWRGARDRAHAPVRKRVSRRVSRGLRGARRGARHPDDGAPVGRRAARDVAVSAARGRTRVAALQAVPRGRADDAVRQPADARAHGHARARRASVSHRGRRPADDLDARSRPAGAGHRRPKSRSTR